MRVRMCVDCVCVCGLSWHSQSHDRLHCVFLEMEQMSQKAQWEGSMEEQSDSEWKSNEMGEVFNPQTPAPVFV